MLSDAVLAWVNHQKAASLTRTVQLRNLSKLKCASGDECAVLKLGQSDGREENVLTFKAILLNSTFRFIMRLSWVSAKSSQCLTVFFSFLFISHLIYNISIPEQLPDSQSY